MTNTINTTQKASAKMDYGIDAPGLVKFFITAGSIALIMAIIAGFLLSSGSFWMITVKLLFGLVAIYLLGMGSLMLYWSKFTKVRGREKVLDLLTWSGNEQVLDVGCGRGLMLIGAAQRLTTGRAIGVDIWEAKDQSLNSADASLDNARLAGVQDKIEVQTADARTLPFPNQTFDVVLSHWVVHNLPSEEDRFRSLSEMVRVLRPKGRLVLADIENRNAYLAFLQSCGMQGSKMIFAPLADAILGAVSFGSFRPTTILATKP